MGGLFAAWLAEVAIVTWRDLTGKAPGHTVKGLPIPSDYLATILIFGGLGLVPKDNPGAARAATLAGWAYVLATLLNVAPAIVNPTNPKTTQQTAPPSATVSG
jgi:hypothetical protein